MSQNYNSEDAIITTKRNVSKIWLLPMVTLLVGLWMVYNHWQSRGITVVIVFETAAGIEAGKTTIRNRNVEIGLVKAVSFNGDHKSIIVEAEIEKGMKNFLKSDSKFWVVKPRIGKEGITGIGTILSGSYIEVAPGTSDTYSNRFIGLELPPATPPGANGLHLTLTSSGGKPVSVGSPVVYQGFQVGKVESYQFDTAIRQANYGIFVQAPFNKLITTNTFFWNSGGLSLTTSAQGISLELASLESLLIGGIEFGVPDDLPIGQTITQHQTFSLYNSKRSVLERREYEYIEYVIMVEGSVGGLYKGAPVDYRGVRVGTVHDPHMSFDEVYKVAGPEEDRIPVIIRLEPGRISDNKALGLDEFNQLMVSWIKRGLTASVSSSNLLTRSLKVSLDYNGEKKTAIEQFADYIVIPIGQSGFAGIAGKVNNVLSVIESLPLNDTVDKTNDLLTGADDTLEDLSNTLEQLDKTLKGLQPDSMVYESVDGTLKELQISLRGLQPDSSLYRSLEKSVTELQVSLDGLQAVLQKLNNKPNSLIFSNPQSSDIEPKANKR
ncbi:MAG: intermembrane transport protein PqiB [Pseudomonadota bacterium]